ncbi:DNA/RNA non-specific endonuclease [Candidatus Symbiopectobacterium sp. NZEC151]|uniref:DNA/RNA non-specific endonuclease n=2 Tax=unclassified Symbiopectobacterium TaxID=2794573 RepID=UPI002226B6C0|nr:DNA/RNA non-specific endonuclease [Candidatus Symbiopectobacterium sp. NZEC151]MCW2473909.1 DNA/RNA non-specific endonuclease [Candidatus Symbiopectobacterium sp. NZEC151]
MYAQVEKPKKNISKRVAQKENNVKQGVGFVDNRPEAVAQRKLQENVMNNSPHIQQIDQFQDNISNQQQRAIQKEESNGYFSDSADDTYASKDENVSTTDRKLAAHKWVTQQISESDPDPEQLKQILEVAESDFKLSAIRVQGDDPGNLKIGYFASPGDWFKLAGRKLIGNNLSDIGIGLGYRIAGMIRGNVEDNNNKALPLWGPLTGRGFGSFMQVNGLNSGNQPDGSGTDSDTLKASNASYKSLMMRRNPGGQSYYVAGHLLRGKLGGPGDEWKNLTPLTQSTNNPSAASHLNQVEDSVLNFVKAGKTITYRVQPVYGRWPWEWPRYFANIIRYGWTPELNEVMATEDHIPTALNCTWWVQGGKGSWIPYSRHIRQWRYTNGESYVIQTKNNSLVNYGNTLEVWDVLQIPAKLAIGAALWSAFPLLPAFALSPHLLRGLAAEAIVDLLGRGGDFLLTEEGGTRIAANRAEIGLLTVAASTFGLPQVTLLDPLLSLIIGNQTAQAQFLSDNEYDLSAVIEFLQQNVLAIPGFRYLSARLPEVQILKGIAVGALDVFHTNPNIISNIANKYGGTLPNRCVAKTKGGQGPRCKNSICTEGRMDKSFLCNVHHH